MLWKIASKMVPFDASFFKHVTGNDDADDDDDDDDYYDY